MIAMLSVFGILLVTATGTTAPFSAMSGAVITMSLLSAGLAAPSDFITSATALASKPALFQFCAQAWRVQPSPAAAMLAAAVTSLRKSLRVALMPAPVTLPTGRNVAKIVRRVHYRLPRESARQ